LLFPQDRKRIVKAMAGHGQKAEPIYLVFHVLGGLVLLFVVAPLLGLVLQSSVGELVETAGDREVQSSIWLTLWVSMAATLFVSIGAIPLAYILARRDFPFKGLVLAVIDIPIVIPHSAAGIALLGVLSRESFAGGIADRIGLSFVDTRAGIMAAMAFVSMPYLINAAREGFAAVPQRLENAAFNLGASGSRVFFTVSLPLARRSILSGLVLMWGRGMSEFGAVMIIAYHPMVTPILLWERFGAFGLSNARPVAILFIGVCLLVFLLLRLLARRGEDARR